MADAIERLANDRTLRTALGERARETARARFTPEAVGSQVARVFEMIHLRSATAQPV
jgi:glycosyltransferase involved in cell wall biosynthesis